MQRAFSRLSLGRVPTGVLNPLVFDKESGSDEESEEGFEEGFEEPEEGFEEPEEESEDDELVRSQVEERAALEALSGDGHEEALQVMDAKHEQQLREREEEETKAELDAEAREMQAEATNADDLKGRQLRELDELRLLRGEAYTTADEEMLKRHTLELELDEADIDEVVRRQAEEREVLETQFNEAAYEEAKEILETKHTEERLAQEKEDAAADADDEQGEHLFTHDEGEASGDFRTQMKHHLRGFFGDELDPRVPVSFVEVVSKVHIADVRAAKKRRLKDAHRTARENFFNPVLDYNVENFGHIIREIDKLVTLAGETMSTDEIVTAATKLRDRFELGHDDAVIEALAGVPLDQRDELLAKALGKSLRQDTGNYSNAIGFVAMERLNAARKKHNRQSKPTKHQLELDIKIAEMDLKERLLVYVFEGIQHTLREPTLKWTSDKTIGASVRGLCEKLIKALNALDQNNREFDEDIARRTAQSEQQARAREAERAAAEAERRAAAMRASAQSFPQNTSFLYGPNGIIINDQQRAQEAQRVAEVSAQRASQEAAQAAAMDQLAAQGASQAAALDQLVAQTREAQAREDQERRRASRQLRDESRREQNAKEEEQANERRRLFDAEAPARLRAREAELAELDAFYAQKSD
jgi:hypothetical protein